MLIFIGTANAQGDAEVEGAAHAPCVVGSVTGKKRKHEDEEVSQQKETDTTATTKTVTPPTSPSRSTSPTSTTTATTDTTATSTPKTPETTTTPTQYFILRPIPPPDDFECARIF